ncbi:MAG: hypothetical protein HY040_06370 [Planctomycetes bacterium]|nr:hypothetical protein [Planctomycetota bacterium]
MERFTISYIDESTSECCPLCGEAILCRKGPRLVLNGVDEPVCRECGNRAAPNLVALLDLAKVAEKVGRQSRHLLTPPMEAMLDLARAAENYSHSAPRAFARAG